MTRPPRTGRHASAWRAATLALCAAGALLVGAASAQAGSYTISECPAAGSNDPGPWSVVATPAGAKATCDAGTGDFIGWVGPSLLSNTSVFLTADATGDITIQRATLWWSVPKSTSGSLMFAEASANGSGIYFAAAPTNGQPQTFDFSANTVATTSLKIGAWCSFLNGLKGCTLGGPDTPGLQLFGARLVLQSDTPPTATVTGGNLAAPGTVSGAGTIDYDAASTVSGVRSVDLMVDNQIVATNSYVAQCTYTTWAACPLTESAQSFTYDTSSLTDGSHDVALQVTDAAGNTTLVDDHTVTTANGNAAAADPPAGPAPAVDPAANPAAAPASDPGAAVAAVAAAVAAAIAPQANPVPDPPAVCNGVCDSAPRLVLVPSATTSTTAAVPWRRSAVTLGGQLLTKAGAPIAGAELQLWETPAGAGARPAELGVARTAGNGTWHFRIPAGPSRTLAVTYRTHLTDAAPAATVTVHETVIGAVGLTAPKLARFGRPLLMHGALAGGFIPSGGTLVGMQIFFSGHWRTIDLVRTDAAGRFAYDYVFAGVAAGTWRFRAFVPAQAAYPFTQSESGPIAVLARAGG